MRSLSQKFATLIISCAFFVTVTDTALASTIQDKDLTLSEAVKLCATFEDDDEKLRCFEALASSVNGKPRSTENVAKDKNDDEEIRVTDNTSKKREKAERKRERRAAKKRKKEERLAKKEQPTFEFTRSDSSKAKRRARAAHENEVYKSWRNGLDELRVAFINGEIWVQVGSKTIINDPKAGDIARITPGALGSWDIKFSGARRALRMRHSNQK